MSRGSRCARSCASGASTRRIRASSWRWISSATGPSTPERVADEVLALLRWEPRREGPANLQPHRHLLVVTRGVVADTPELDAAGAAGALERVRRASGLGRRIVEHVVRLALTGRSQGPDLAAAGRGAGAGRGPAPARSRAGRGGPEARMSLQVFNTLGRRKEPFVPVGSGPVGLYVCGVTVYDLAHVGHARSALVFDVIRRYLAERGYRVRVVKNFTDVDDRIIARAAQTGEPPAELAQRYVEAYRRDMAALGVDAPDVEPKATEHVPHMIALIERLLAAGVAYVVEGDVNFEVRRFPGYGRLSGRDLDELRAGARVEIDERKRDPLDFVLWKAAKPGEPSWASPWGPGRPGWHIECSAMAMEYLGAGFDLHGGGEDLIFPHHENEIAQSEAATGVPFARYWLHNAFVNLGAEKMSKSLGNVRTIEDLVRRHDRGRHPPGAPRHALPAPAGFLGVAPGGGGAGARALPRPVRGHRGRRGDPGGPGTPSWTPCATPSGGSARRWTTTSIPPGPGRALRPDPHAPRDAAGAGLGGGRAGPRRAAPARRGARALPGRPAGPPPEIRAEVDRLLGVRADARRRRAWGEADALRAQLAALGVPVEDTPGGTTWRWRGKTGSA